MSFECSECERDMRGGHDPLCSRATMLDEHFNICDECDEEILCPEGMRVKNELKPYPEEDE